MLESTQIGQILYASLFAHYQAKESFFFFFFYHTALFHPKLNILRKPNNIDMKLRFIIGLIDIKIAVLFIEDKGITKDARESNPSYC